MEELGSDLAPWIPDLLCGLGRLHGPMGLWSRAPLPRTHGGALVYRLGSLCTGNNTIIPKIQIVNLQLHIYI